MQNDKNRNEDQSSKAAEDLYQKGRHQNASSDLDDPTGTADNDSTTTGRIAATERSSASSSKTNVTGSDLDGQTSF